MLQRPLAVALTILLAISMLTLAGCNTKPSGEDRKSFVKESHAALEYFEDTVPGIRTQIRHSAGYAVFPGVGQWGIFILGGRFGRGLVERPGGTQVGWAAINTASAGLQLGGQGMKMLFIFEDETAFERFRENRLEGSGTATAVAGDAGAQGTAPFQNGVAVYIGGQKGLMAGASVALDYLRFEDFEDDHMD